MSHKYEYLQGSNISMQIHIMDVTYYLLDR